MMVFPSKRFDWAGRRRQPNAVAPIVQRLLTGVSGLALFVDPGDFRHPESHVFQRQAHLVGRVLASGVQVVLVDARRRNSQAKAYAQGQTARAIDGPADRLQKWCAALAAGKRLCLCACDHASLPPEIGRVARKPTLTYSP